MAKGKYQKWLEPDGLLLLEGWARDGLTDEQIAKNIGCSVRTLYEWKERYPQISQSLKKGKPRAVVVDPSAASFIAELRQRSYAVQKADNDVLDGIRDTAQRIQAGELLFHRDCTHTLEEFQAYVWDEKASLQGLDKPVKANDHCMDAMRYFSRTILGRQVVSVKRRPRGL